jgi:hypothetical protein
MPVQLNAGQEFVSLSHRLYIDAGALQGDAIAASFDGSEMQYLVVTTDDSPPVWVTDSEITKCWVRTN